MCLTHAEAVRMLIFDFVRVVVFDDSLVAVIVKVDVLNGFNNGFHSTVGKFLVHFSECRSTFGNKIALIVNAPCDFVKMAANVVATFLGHAHRVDCVEVMTVLNAVGDNVTLAPA